MRWSFLYLSLPEQYYDSPLAPIQYERHWVMVIHICPPQRLVDGRCLNIRHVRYTRRGNRVDDIWMYQLLVRKVLELGDLVLAGVGDGSLRFRLLSERLLLLEPSYRAGE